ncbi:MAG TPA: hypothetical protein VHY20_02565 [Pirellulales bacterium]|nr:hypothetical protein [Pirellulales bacterium]
MSEPIEDAELAEALDLGRKQADKAAEMAREEAWGDYICALPGDLHRRYIDSLGAPARLDDLRRWCVSVAFPTIRGFRKSEMFADPQKLLAEVRRAVLAIAKGAESELPEVPPELPIQSAADAENALRALTQWCETALAASWHASLSKAPHSQPTENRAPI